jgi:hypothetical protein
MGIIKQSTTSSSSAVNVFDTARWKYSRHVQPSVPNTIPESFEKQAQAQPALPVKARHQLSTDSTSMELLLIALQTTAETFHSIRFVRLLFLLSHSSQRRDSDSFLSYRHRRRTKRGMICAW